MAALRYPANIDALSPFVLFTTHRPKYNTAGTDILSEQTGNSVALYIPQGTYVTDNLRWEGTASGATGTAFEQIMNGNFQPAEGLQAVAVNNAETIAGLGLGAAAQAAGNNVVATGLTGAGTASVVANIKSEALKTYQRTLNPREFMLFKAPGMRAFGFNFTFIPTSEREANDVPEIIKFFRKASYPELHKGGYDYMFPDAFNVKFGGTEKMIKIPEVVCTSVTTTYNPNSISFFKQNGMPVEITLSLQFQELKPIDRSMVDKGY